MSEGGLVTDNVGGALSRVMVRVTELELPAASVAVTSTVLSPSVRDRSYANSPDESTTTGRPLMVNETAVESNTLPAMLNDVSEVTTSFDGIETVNVGEDVSKMTDLESELEFPAASVAIVASVLCPSLSAILNMKEPSGLTDKGMPFIVRVTDVES